LKYVDHLTETRFLGVEGILEEAKYRILGVPLDLTSTYRPGSRFGPAAIRKASLNLESYCLRNGVEVEDLKIRDLGDLNVSGDLERTLDDLKNVIGEISGPNRIPVVLGGEHTVTYGCVKALGDVGVLSFDAHMDLRDEYLAVSLSHATFMRRLSESLGADNIVEVGVRAVCREELEFAEKTGLNYFTSLEVLRHDAKWVAKQVQNILSGFDRVYLTIDVDVLDPAYAPAVGNPVPEGLPPTLLLDILQLLCDVKIVGFDLVEVSPNFDSGLTAFQAAHIIFNVLAFLYSNS
jgi:agmatinase